VNKPGNPVSRQEKPFLAKARLSLTFVHDLVLLPRRVPGLSKSLRGRDEEGGGMITLTPVAVAKVKAILAERKEEAGLRIAVVGGGCSGFQYQMTLDKEPKADDEVMSIDGLRVFVDTRSLLYLNGAKVDYVDGLNGSGFKFDNPNARASCGCGESFDA
jgi:iron-sulfur cluster assembly protein